LIDLDIDAIKIASGELTNLELIQKSIESSKPLFISTGMSDYNEISSVMQLINLANYNDKVVLMQCTSVYPCPPEMAGLNVVSEFTRKYKVKIGFSDHTNSNSAAVIASYLGANYIEKHITFSNLMYGSDAKFAYTPDRFLNYVKEINDSRLMRQFPVNKDNITPFLHSREVFQKSLTLNKNLKKGSILTSDDLVLKKPGNGLPHSDLKNIVGRKTLKDLFIDDQITFQDVK
jgi:N-acetylneuraminate synthase